MAGRSSPSGSDGDKKDTPISLFTLSDGAKRFMKEHRTPLASGTASCIATGFLFPLDFLKSRMQSFETKLIPTIQDAYKAEGARGFWRGVGPPLMSITLVRTISFSIYQKTKYHYAEYFEKIFGENPLSIANQENRYPTLSTMLCFGAAGASTGAIVSVVACPFELTKLSAQLAGKINREPGPGQGSSASSAANGNDLKRSAIRTAIKLFHERGAKGLYAGYRLHLLRDLFGTGMYFTTYESAKQILGNGRGHSPTSPFAVMAGGALCGIVSWACTYPIDVAKTVYQKSLLTSGGQHVPVPKIHFFKVSSYRGLAVSCTRSALINMTFFSLFEMFKAKINELEIDGDYSHR